MRKKEEVLKDLAYAWDILKEYEEVKDGWFAIRMTELMQGFQNEGGFIPQKIRLEELALSLILRRLDETK